MLRQCSSTKIQILYRAFCVCSVLVPSTKEHYSHDQSVSLELFHSAFVFHREVLQLVVQEHCYCRNSCDARVKEMVGNRLRVTISFLKIKDRKLIQPWSLAWSLSLSWKASGRKHLCFSGGEDPLLPITFFLLPQTVFCVTVMCYQNMFWGNRRSWLSLLLLKILHAPYHALLLRAGV